MILLGAALIASCAVLFVLEWNLTFFQDTWAFLLERQGSSIGDFLRPHNEHLVVLSVVVNKLCVTIFGMTTAKPEMVVMTLSLAAVGLLLFVYLKRCVGAWLALFAVVPVLFLGTSWMVLLWPFEIVFPAAIAAGLGMMLMLERGDDRGDAWACILLIVSIGFGSIGLSFAVAAIVDVFVRRRSRGWRRAYLVVIPLILYFLWYVGWGHDAEHHLTLHNILSSPRYLFEGLASSVGAFFGLTPATGAATAEPDWGRPLLIALAVLVVFVKRRKPQIPPTFWVAAAALLSYWLLAAFNYIPGREASANRYIYAGVIFLLLTVAELFRGWRPDRRALWAGAAVAVFSLGPNLDQLKEGADIFKLQSGLTKTVTGSLEIARRTVPPDFLLTPENSGTLAVVEIVPGPYFEAADGHGTPAYTPAQLAAAPEGDRHWADILLSKALPISVAAHPGPPPAGPACEPVAGGAGPASPELTLRPGLTRIWLAPGPATELTARRFAEKEYPVDLGSAAGGSVTEIRIPRDRAPQPWHLHFEAAQRAVVCPGS